MDPATITTMLSAASAAVDLAKKLGAGRDAMKEAEFKLAAAELISKVVDLKIMVATLQEESLKLRAELNSARAAEDLRSRMEFRDAAIYLNDPPKGYHVGPYCLPCWYSNEKLLGLLEDERKAPYCTTCKQYVMPPQRR